MTNEQAIKMAKASLKCLERDVSGQNEMCNSHKCDECNLTYEKGNMGEQKEWLRMAIQALEQTKWIPASERLPEKSGDYWCTFGGTNLTGSDHYLTESDAKKIFDDPEEYIGWESQNVIAWMSQPKPYKAENEKKQEQIRNEKLINDIDFAIKATGSQDDYSMGMRNGMRYVKYLIDGKEPQYEIRRTEKEKKFELNLGDEVIGDSGAKGVVVGIDTYKDEVMLSLLMKNHKVPQIVKASMYKTKTGRHFPQIIEVLEQIKGESENKNDK